MYHNFLRCRAVSLFLLDRAILLGHLYERHQRHSASCLFRVMFSSSCARTLYLALVSASISRGGLTSSSWAAGRVFWQDDVRRTSSRGRRSGRRLRNVSINVSSLQSATLRVLRTHPSGACRCRGSSAREHLQSHHCSR
ncbi:hypothetical protein EXIGLDRAFT_478388 [Exidia glandulosa HHB12029]|uniref:Secreted protein n=1 Tax=Exidia glandulosa HHB12029 TaxID=1314781 RepID=A0A165JTQ5_EXIGL|nr:hypothetical protein EXIGLDRAFT_478388 [Exidia glandulosa HHB12029]